METIVYKSVNGLDIHADVYPSAGPSPAPVLVWIHGGALIMGNRRCVHPALSALISEAGNAQVSIDYRLAPETKLPSILEDVCDAFAWVRGPCAERFGLDANRVAVVGHSGGGYLALMAGVHAQPRPRAIASFYGYGDIVGEWYSAPDPHYCKFAPVSKDDAYAAVGGAPLSEDLGDKRRWSFYLYCRQHGIWPREVSGFTPERPDSAYAPYCPERMVTTQYPPTILLHGTNDTDVPYALSVQMAESLAAAQVTYELVTVPNGPHGFDGGLTLDDTCSADPSDAATAVVRAAAFLVEHNART